MKLTFKGKTALVTGGSGGIGLSIVQKLIENHIKVIIFDKNNINKRFSKNKYIEFIKLDLSIYPQNQIHFNIQELREKLKCRDYPIDLIFCHQLEIAKQLKLFFISSSLDKSNLMNSIYLFFENLLLVLFLSKIITFMWFSINF